ncbi:flavin-containing monooxygenase [Brucella gallinifaecis]|uniref:NAD(P)/FAD-dependent oxidoreductase n=1 Tax=Brucella gallinifaecis TaxID=215590 RepID=A0A502BKP1_9HYPH|nr:NAD(P)/FAD-dependent oxidoreductase [Brucella gallinifaecis]TPF74397.1 NAD(P)/FAD-dependent oxidoreductase [Brucella gallinifaecis]
MEQNSIRFKHAIADEAALRTALAGADIAPTLMVLVQLTGDMTILDEVRPYIHGAWNFMEDVPETLKEKVRDRLVLALKEKAQSGEAPAITTEADRLQRMMSAAVGQDVPAEYIPLLIEEMRFGEDTRTVEWRQKPAQLTEDDFKVVVIGAGFSGLCAAVMLQHLGIPFVVLEKNDEVGGTWYENTYPGCGVDTPNHFFSYSFFPYNKWSHHFSKREEIQGYIEQAAAHFELRQHIRFGVEVSSATFDKANGKWTVTARGRDGHTQAFTSNAVITAVGQLNRPAYPHIDGLESFAGPVFHTAKWDHSVDLTGKRVAMIGTGASGMQAGPSIAGDVKSLTVFQRSPHWVMPNENYHKPVSEGQKWALQNIPYFSEWYRFQLFWASSDGFHASLQMDPNWEFPDISLNAANHQMRERIIAHIRKELDGDEELISKCIPSYPPYGKRMLRDNHWFKMLKRDNVELVDTSISHITPNAIVTKDGAVHEVDVIVMATGFQAAKILWPMEITGRDGMTIRNVWGDDDPRAYKGISVPGFPNLFVTFGPNTNLAHGGSAIFHFECQVHFIMQALREMIENGQSTSEVRQDVHDAYNSLVDRKCANMVWAHPGVSNWYKNKDNRVTVTSPWRLVDYWQLTRSFEPSEYVFEPLKNCSLQRKTG